MSSDRKIAKVYLVDGSFKGIQVTASTTVDDLVKVVAQKHELVDTEYFALYEVNKDVETVLEGMKRPADLMTQWYERDPTGKSYKFLFKRRLFFKEKPLTKDPVCQNLLYIQAVNDVVTSNYPCSTDEALKLAGIQMFCSYGSYNPDLHKPGFLTTKTHHFVPRLLLPSNTSERWEELILAQHRSFSAQSMSPAEAKVMYLNICMKWPFYGCTFFLVNTAATDTPATRVYLGVNYDGIMTLSYPNKDVIRMHKYTDICSWSSSSQQFSIVVGQPQGEMDDSQGDAAQTNSTFPFYTTQGKAISDAVQAYIDVILKEMQATEGDDAV